MPRAGLPWSHKEIAFLKQNATRMTVMAISQELGRTEASVERKLRDQHLRSRSEWLVREPLPRTLEEMEAASRQHLNDLRQAGHTWWHKFPADEPDVEPGVLPARVSTFSVFSCIGSPAAMCAED